MFYIIIPILIIIIFLFKRKESFEKFTNPPSIEKPKYTSDYLTQITTPEYNIQMIKLNPFFEKEILNLDRVVNEDGSLNYLVPEYKENTEWKTDFQKRLCLGCACTNPDKYCVKENNNFGSISSNFLGSYSSSSIIPEPSPSTSPQPSPSTSPQPSPSTSQGPIPSTSPGTKSFYKSGTYSFYKSRTKSFYKSRTKSFRKQYGKN